MIYLLFSFYFCFSFHSVCVFYVDNYSSLITLTSCHCSYSNSGEIIPILPVSARCYSFILLFFTSFYKLRKGLQSCQIFVINFLPGIFAFKSRKYEQLVCLYKFFILKMKNRNKAKVCFF